MYVLAGNDAQTFKVISCNAVVGCQQPCNLLIVASRLTNDCIRLSIIDAFNMGSISASLLQMRLQPIYIRQYSAEGRLIGYLPHDPIRAFKAGMSAMPALTILGRKLRIESLVCNVHHAIGSAVSII